jgi:hypothetical protein
MAHCARCNISVDAGPGDWPESAPWEPSMKGLSYANEVWQVSRGILSECQILRDCCSCKVRTLPSRASGEAR